MDACGIFAGPTGMETQQVVGGGFGAANFGTAELGDRRRTRRLVLAADEMLRHPEGTLPKKLRDPGGLKAVYRLMDVDEVTHASVLEPHRQLTRRRMAACPETVLVIHDSTELDYTGKVSLAPDLGQLGEGYQRGYLAQNSLAVSFPTREVLGLANQILYRRAKVPQAETRQQSRARKNRESRLWAQGCAVVGLPPEGRTWVDISDRGSDLFEYLDFQHARGGRYVVRSKHNRQLVAAGEVAGKPLRLHDYARVLPTLATKAIEVPARDGRPARQARVRIAAAAVTLLPPKHPRGEHRNAPLRTWVVYVGEIDPPAQVKEPVEWFLLTNVPPEGAEPAAARVEWYCCRWMVEEYHKAQKTGCGIESPQFERVERLEPMIALLSVVAVGLLQLRWTSRRPEAQKRLATELMPETHVAVLSAWRFKKVRLDLTVQEFCLALARLGGHQNRRGDHPPGWLALWKGWSVLEDMVAGAVAMRALRSG
jgi:hypothetical protein